MNKQYYIALDSGEETILDFSHSKEILEVSSPEAETIAKSSHGINYAILVNLIPCNELVILKYNGEYCTEEEWELKTKAQDTVDEGTRLALLIKKLTEATGVL